MHQSWIIKTDDGNITLSFITRGTRPTILIEHDAGHSILIKGCEAVSDFLKIIRDTKYMFSDENVCVNLYKDEEQRQLQLQVTK